MNSFSYRFGPGALTSITTPSNAAYNFGKGDFAIEAWVKTFHGGPVLARMVRNHRGFVLSLDINRVIFTTHDVTNWNSLEGSSSICDGRWHHVAAVRSGGSGFLYVDGKALTTQSSGNASPPVNVDSTDRLTIGSVDLKTQSNRFFRGLMAEIRLWNKARTSEEILQNMNQRLQSATLSPNLVGYWTAEFGYTSDLSQYRNTVIIEGILSGSGEIPPLSPSEIETFSTLFHGIYNISSNDSTNPLARELAVTIEGFVIIDRSKVIKGSQIQGTRLVWPKMNNNFAGNLQFIVWSNDDKTEQFSGTFTQGDAEMNVKGRLAPSKVGCGIMLNVGTGLVLSCPNASSTSEVELAPKDPHTHDHFCRYEAGGILHMHSGHALKPATANTGASIYLTNPTMGGPHQSWTMQNGNIILKENPALAITGIGGQVPTLAVTDARDQAQQWVSLDNSQIVFNGMGSVLSTGTGSGTEVRVEAKTDGSPKQGWYFFQNALINEATAQALTTTGELNSTFSLARWSPTNIGQQFVFTGINVVHKATGYIVGVTSAGNQPVLQKSSTAGSGVAWSLNSPVRLPLGSPKLERARGNENATYTVKVYTEDVIAGGTNDKVEIYLQGPSQSVGPIELKTNTTGMDPFERGQTDTFRFEKLDIGAIEAITIRYGANNWLWNDRWVVGEVVVTNENRNTMSTFTPRGLTTQTAMPYVAFLHADRVEYVGTTKCKMAVGMAPALDEIGKKFGWHHTWVSVVDNGGNPPKKTWFDCAGSHEGPGTINDVVTGVCDRQTVVRMSTGFPYDDTHPLQEAYGSSRTDGVGNANLRAEGRLNWQGQCHQIANRYLWSCIPSTTITSVPNDQRPNGYGLGVLTFGTFGIGFREWVRQVGFNRDAGYSSDSIYGLVQPIVKLVNLIRDVQATRLDLNHDILTGGANEPSPGGPAVRRFLKRLRDRGLSVNQLARMTNYTDAQINELLS